MFCFQVNSVITTVFVGLVVILILTEKSRGSRKGGPCFVYTQKHQTASNSKSENLFLFLPKTENRERNRTETAIITKTEVFWHKSRKTDLKNGRNRKTKNPNTPPLC